MKNKATPGPWSVSNYFSGDERLKLDDYNVNTSDGVTVAQCGASEENSRLIAAAPELLEALKGFVVQTQGRFLEHSNEHSARVNAIAAITKAEGGDECAEDLYVMDGK